MSDEGLRHVIGGDEVDNIVVYKYGHADRR